MRPKFNIIDRLRNEIQYRKQEAVEILRHRYSDKQIKDLCQRVIDTSADVDLQQVLEKEGHPPESFYALIALCCLMDLERNAPPKSDLLLTAADSSNLVLTGFNAMLCLVEAGWKPAEPFALTRLKQVKNQPANRQRNNIEKDDIEEWLISFKENKGVPPATLGFFLDYLEVHGFNIDSAKRTVDKCDGTWRKERSFRTIDGWLRDFKKMNSRKKVPD